MIDPEMKEYTCNMKVQARPMKRGEYNLYRGWKIPADENPDDDGFLCQRGDGSERWVPEALFLSTHFNDAGKISDGYHTFDELYEFRKLYNAALFNEWAVQGKFSVHKSKKHFDGEECFGGGWFIVVAVLPSGQISNHYKLEDWELFQVRETEKALFEFDGHTAGDVADRLFSLCAWPGKLQESEDLMLKWFAFEHLPEHLQCASRQFHATAKHVVDNTAQGPERTVALRKLLEAKDAAVRAVLHPGS